MHFEQRDWGAGRADALERLKLYKLLEDDVVAKIHPVLAAQLSDRITWQRMLGYYAGWVIQREDFELAETFFNSTVRRIFTGMGADPELQFLDRDFDSPAAGLNRNNPRFLHRLFSCEDTLTDLVRRILNHFNSDTPFLDFEWDVQETVRTIERAALIRLGTAEFDAIDMLDTVFYRGQAAYLAGMVRKDTPAGEVFFPVVIAMRNPEGGVVVDAVLTMDEQISILFSYTQAYFHVMAESPYSLVNFLQQMIPRKRLAELYAAVGYPQHGKTEFYRDWSHSLENSQDQFVAARGERGRVMAVFTLPSYEVVFKLIKDKIGDAKITTRGRVAEKYHLVFLHDRAGRLVEAQEFEHLSFEKKRFDPVLLDELLENAPSTVAVDGERVVIHHLYVERRVTPLDIYLSEVDAARGLETVLDYGQAIKDLAAKNIFPGNVLLRNFGVTRYGRVIFYDYDELCLVTECNFRHLSQEPQEGDNFVPGREDVFPGALRTSLELGGTMRKAFEQAHGAVFEVEFWQGWQKRLAIGEMLDILPYQQAERLMPG